MVIFALFGAKPAAVAPGWKQRGALGWMGCGMLPSYCPAPPALGTHSSLLSSPPGSCRAVLLALVPF